MQKFARVEVGIYVGDSRAATAQSMAAEDITAVINLTNKSNIIVSAGDVICYALPNQELLDTEIPKTIAKLETISADIYDLRSAGRNVLICCDDGKGKSMLAAGHYLISKLGKKYDEVIPLLETWHFTPEQRAEDLAYRDSLLNMDDQSKERLAARNAVRCLTMQSHRKILRLCGGAKK